MSASLSVRDALYRYPDGTLGLDRLSLEVAAGERIALLGPNGAGKTTLARLLNGLETAAAGTVAVGGTVIDDANRHEMRRRVQLLFSSSDEQLFMPTVADDVAFGPSNLGLAAAETALRVERSLDAVGGRALADRIPHRLSTGEKRRAALAGVLALEPEVLVLDEPTAGLDPAGKRLLIGHLSSLGQTQVLITHDLPVAAELCPRAAVINRGRVQAVGSTLALLADRTLMADNGLELPFGFSPPPPTESNPEADSAIEPDPSAR